MQGQGPVPDPVGAGRAQPWPWRCGERRGGCDGEPQHWEQGGLQQLPPRDGHGRGGSAPAGSGTAPGSAPAGSGTAPGSGPAGSGTVPCSLPAGTGSGTTRGSTPGSAPAALSGPRRLRPLYRAMRVWAWSQSPCGPAHRFPLVNLHGPRMRSARCGRGRRERETGTGKNRDRNRDRDREPPGPGSPGSPGMRRRRRGGGAVPAEACGVWLDTAELKRGPARPLSARLEAASPGPRRRQSTIPAFFSPLTDGRDKENSRPRPCTPNKGCGRSGAPLAACPVKILALPQLEGAREEPPGAEQGVQGTSQAWKTPLEPLELQVESQSQSKASGDSWCCSLSQGSEHSGIGAHRNKSRLFPGETASGSRKPQPWSTVTSGPGFAGTENTNPVPGAAPSGVCCSPQPLREWGQTPEGSCGQLLCQDSQGNRITAHRARGSSLGASSSPSQPWGLQSLFTQDSQGNRVIKHC
ncbi:collagen alpha-1(I) chain-like [Poecile atricapillus]|uniref:collagen alpha-1(I) chain-like n=1 Tax=Poecile atricapillus TaxID=48891 RepID=UPI00273A5130|nr:collagen alpha-1(I) chain-like [Poecile atricapillus]